LELKNIRKTIGLKQTIRLIESDTAEYVIIASDADDKVVHAVRNLCIAKGIGVVPAESMKILGKACHIDVGAAVVGIIKDDVDKPGS